MEIVAAVDVSVIPQPSSTSTPAASKKLRISGLIGAAPETARRILPPNRPRIFDSTFSSAKSYWRLSRKPGSPPERSSARILLPTLIDQLKIAFLRPPSLSIALVAVV